MFGLEHKQFPSTLAVPIYTAFHKFKHWQTQGLDHLHVIFHVWSIWLLTARLLLCMLFSKTDSPKFIRCHRGARFTYIWQYILKYQIPHPVLEEAFTLRTTVNNDFSFCLHPAWIRGMFIHATEPGWSDYTATGCGAQPDFFFIVTTPENAEPAITDGLAALEGSHEKNNTLIEFRRITFFFIQSKVDVGLLLHATGETVEGK